MSRVQYWVATVLGAMCFAAMAVNIALSHGNNLARVDITQRQQFVQQSLQLEGLYREIIRALAELGARNNDGDVKALLLRHGITFSVNAAVSGNAPVAPAAQARK